MINQAPSLLPGFRFHPTDEELILYYLRKRAASSPCPVSIIAEVDIYKFDPWELPGPYCFLIVEFVSRIWLTNELLYWRTHVSLFSDRALFGDKEWYFFSPRDRKYPNGVRPNRAAASGYWKATGTDKPIVTSEGNENIGVKKALVFYKGKPPRGIKTNWIMHEYRLSESKNKCNIRPMKLRDSSMRVRSLTKKHELVISRSLFFLSHLLSFTDVFVEFQLDDWVLCRIYQKCSHLSEDSAGTESPISNIQNSATTQDHNNLSIHKSSSLSELLNEADFSLLSRLLETPIETQMPSNSNQPFINMHQYSETVPSNIPFAENSLKRQREEGGNLFPAQKKSNNNNSWAYTNFTNQFDTQAFFNQQLLLNAQLGMQWNWLKKNVLKE